MTRRVMPGSGIKRKLAHVIVVLKSAKRPAEIQDGPRMAISKATARFKQRDHRFAKSRGWWARPRLRHSLARRAWP